MMAEEAASLKYEINNAKKTGMLNGKELSEAEIKEFEEEVKFLELEVENTKENYLEEVKLVNQVLDIRQADMQVEFETPEIDFQLASLDIEQNLQIQEAQIQEEQGLQQEFQAIEMLSLIHI